MQIWAVLKLSRSATFLNAGVPLRHFLPTQLFQAKMNNRKYCRQVRLSSLSVCGPRTLLGEITALPRPLLVFRGPLHAWEGGKGRGRKGRGAFPTSFLQFNHRVWDYFYLYPYISSPYSKTQTDVLSHCSVFI